jgi:four helix bundle protein
MKNFKELKIWQKGIEIAADCFKITAIFPKYEQFGLVSQLNRACVSIPSIIAEGSSRTSSKDYNRFIEYSLGSCFEAETQFLIAKQLNYASPDLIEAILLRISEEEKMLTSFSKRLKSFTNS